MSFFTIRRKDSEVTISILITFTTSIKSLQQSLPYAAWDCLVLAYESLDGRLCLKEKKKLPSQTCLFKEEP